MTSYKEGYSEEWEVFPGLPFLVREDCICREAARQMSMLQEASPHFPGNFLYGVHESRDGKDLILAVMN